MRRFFLSAALFALRLVAVLALAATPAFAASTLSGVRIDPLPTGGALVSVTFQGGLPVYHVSGAGTTEPTVIFDATAAGPQVPPTVLGAGPVTNATIASTGASTSVALHLSSASGVTVRAGGNAIFINVSAATSQLNPFGLQTTQPVGPAAGQITELVPLKYADVSEIAGILVAGSNVASNDTFSPQQTSLGTNSLGGSSFGGVTGSSFGQAPAAQAFGPNAFGQTAGVAQRLNDNVAIDRRLNAIFLTGTPDQIAGFKEIIAKLDIPVQSVVLETQIVELDDTAAKTIGLDLAPDGTGAIIEATGASTGGGATIRTGAFPQLGANLNANLYAQVQLGNAKIIAKPRILAESGEPASILTGDAIPIVTNVVVAGAGSISSQQVNYVNVGVNLQIQPRVSSDGFVTSHIYSEVSSVTQYVNGIPQISQRTASTIASVRDGQSFVIGGLLQDNEIRNLSKIPFIGDIPLIGVFFRHVTTSLSQTNLYVVVTPHIVAAPGVTPSSAPLSIPTSLPQSAPPPGPGPEVSTPPLVPPVGGAAPSHH
jgi:general secretion pathway protein D